MLKSYKTEIDPTETQAWIIRSTAGTCRHVYNLYVSENIRRFENGEPFISGMLFSKWLNNEYLPEHPEKAWIKDVSSKSVKKAIMNGDTAFQNFFSGKSNFPKFKKKNKCRDAMYFVKNNSKDCLCERHRLKIPTLGWVRLKEKGYIPYGKNAPKIKSGTITIKAGRYYVSVIVEIPEANKPNLNEFGIGVDLGVKDLAIISTGKTVKNINKTARVKKIEKKLRREQRKLSRKYEAYKKDKEKLEKENKNNKEKGEKATLRLSDRKNFKKQIRKIQKIHQRLNNIRTAHVDETVDMMVKAKPSFITIEDLNVSGMMKNKCLSKAIAAQKLSELRTKLQNKCHINGIELRIADRWYPSSKTCHKCGYVKKDLKLSERTYVCPVCGYTQDRDLNAAMNLRDLKTYEIAP